jgi:hypothetical protein
VDVVDVVDVVGDVVGGVVGVVVPVPPPPPPPEPPDSVSLSTLAGRSGERPRAYIDPSTTVATKASRRAYSTTDAPLVSRRFPICMTSPRAFPGLRAILPDSATADERAARLGAAKSGQCTHISTIPCRLDGARFTSGAVVPIARAEGFANEGGNMSTVAGGTTTAYVVRDADGKVVVAFWGAAAIEEVERWRERNYQVERVTLAVD